MTTHQSMTVAARIDRADDYVTTSVDDGEFTAFFTTEGEWVSDDRVNGGRRYWERTCTMIGATLEDDCGKITVMTEDDVVAKYGLALVEALAREAEEDGE